MLLLDEKKRTSLAVDFLRIKPTTGRYTLKADIFLSIMSEQVTTQHIRMKKNLQLNMGNMRFPRVIPVTSELPASISRFKR